LKKEVRKAVETGIQKIVFMAPWILEPVVKPFFSSRRNFCGLKTLYLARRETLAYVKFLKGHEILYL